jgi:hypothetical protein
MQLATSCVVLTVPLFFAGIIFSSLIGEARINISTAFAYNLMGALFGGVMEYNSMYFGFAFLYLLAMGFYFLAWAFSWKSAPGRQLRSGHDLTKQWRKALSPFQGRRVGL